LGDLKWRRKPNLKESGGDENRIIPGEGEKEKLLGGGEKRNISKGKVSST